jgi:hypothetical protein
MELGNDDLERIAEADRFEVEPPIPWTRPPGRKLANSIGG